MRRVGEPDKSSQDGKGTPKLILLKELAKGKKKVLGDFSLLEVAVLEPGLILDGQCSICGQGDSGIDSAVVRINLLSGAEVNVLGGE